MKLLRTGWLLLLPLAACNGPGETDVSGSISGAMFIHAEAVSVNGADVMAGTPQALVLIADEASYRTGPLGSNNLCSALNNGLVQNSSTVLSVTLQQTDAVGNPVEPTPGDYVVVQEGLTAAPPNTRFASIVFLPAQTSGTGMLQVTDLNLSGGEVKGTFDLLFGFDHVSGTFSAPHCAVHLTQPVPDDFDAGVGEGGPPDSFDGGFQR